jgi:uncharacterized protein YifE (UPF0438 family)
MTKNKYWDPEAISEIIESLDNNICSHKYDMRHYTRGHMRGGDYSGGDIWETYCVRCDKKKDFYAVSCQDEVDWDRIKNMKKEMIKK